MQKGAKYIAYFELIITVVQVLGACISGNFLALLFAIPWAVCAALILVSLHKQDHHWLIPHLVLRVRSPVRSHLRRAGGRRSTCAAGAPAQPATVERRALATFLPHAHFGRANACKRAGRDDGELHGAGLGQRLGNAPTLPLRRR